MSLRTISSLVVAVFFGLIAVVVIRSYLTARPTTIVAAQGLSPVVVAVAPVERGAALTPQMLKVVNYPAESIPVGAFRTVDELTGKGAVAHTVLRPLSVNEPIMASKITGAGGKATLSAALTPGMRAVSVRSSDVAGVGGFVLPGDRVDIMVTRSYGSGDKATTVTQILAENALVLGVDQSDDMEADKPVVAKAVTVEVTPDQAQSISLAQSVGTVALALRQVADDGALVRKATTVSDLGGFGPRSVTPRVMRRAGNGGRKANPGTEVRVTRGVEVSSYSISSL